jgi:Bacterial capsule synthesis protein PGA_cap
MRLGVVAFSDHPAEFAAAEGRAGIAYACVPGAQRWVHRAIAAARQSADAVLVTPHWGPNMNTEPMRHVRAAAAGLLKAGATLVAGHSAHLFHGTGRAILHDLGDFLDDYATHPVLRNDLGLLWLLDLDNSGPRRVEALPLKLDYSHAPRRRRRRRLDRTTTSPRQRDARKHSTLGESTARDRIHGLAAPAFAVPAGRSTPIPLRDDFADRGLVATFVAEGAADRRVWRTPSGYPTEAVLPRARSSTCSALALTWIHRFAGS